MGKLTHKKIKLTMGEHTLVDAADYEWLNQWKWSVRFECNTAYARRSNNKLKTSIIMSRLILNAPKGMIVDHINGDGLDNRRSNLRLCTPKQSKMNTKSRKNTSSKYKGVTWNKKANRWIAQVQNGKRHIYLGAFAKEIEAAICYDDYAEKNHGEFAKFNIPARRKKC